MCNAVGRACTHNAVARQEIGDFFKNILKKSVMCRMAALSTYDDVVKLVSGSFCVLL